MRLRSRVMVLFVTVALAGGGAEAARAETQAAAEACAARIVPIAEAEALLEGCDDFAEPRALLDEPPALGRMTEADLNAARDAGANTVCVRDPVRLPDAAVPAEVRLDARIVTPAHGLFLPDPIVRAGWSVRLDGGEWSDRTEPADWAVPAAAGSGWLDLPRVGVAAEGADAQLDVRLRIDVRGRVWFASGEDEGERGVAGPSGGEPPSVFAAALERSAGAGVLRLTGEGEGWAAARPVPVTLMRPVPAGFIDVYAESMRAAHARTLAVPLGYEFDVAAGTFDVSWGYGMGSAFHIGGGLWITAHHVLGWNAAHWLTSDASAFLAMGRAMDAAQAVGRDRASGTIPPGTVLGPAEVGGRDAARDVALLRAAEPAGRVALELALGGPRAGQAVVTAQGTRGVVTGAISGPDGLYAGSVSHTARTWGGMSGGPIVNDCGRVAGVVSWVSVYGRVVERWMAPSGVVRGALALFLEARDE